MAQSPTVKRTHRLVKQVRIIDVINLFIILLIVGYAAYALFYPFKLIDVHNLTPDGKIPIVEKRVAAGSYVKYRIKSERHSGDTITVIRSLVNGQEIPFSANLSNRLPGVSEFVVETLLPVNLNPGKYHLRICYQADFPLDRTVVNCFETERFEVFLPEGVDPDADGIVVPHTNNVPSAGSEVPLESGDGSQSPIQYVEPEEVRQQHEEAESQQEQRQSNNSSGTNNGATPADNDRSLICSLLSLESDVLLPVRIC